MLGHRGDPEHHPENTLRGYESAIAAGADGVELDVHLTADGVAVCIHDDTLLRTAGVDARVDALGWPEIDALGKEIPALDTVLHALRAHTVAVEIKPPHATTPHLASMVLDIARRQHAQDVILLAFDHAHLAAARRIDAQVVCGALTREKPADPLQVLDACGAQALAPRWEHIDAALCALLAEHHRDVYAWTVDDADAARRLAAVGVRVLISNRPTELAHAVQPLTF